MPTGIQIVGTVLSVPFIKPERIRSDDENTHLANMLMHYHSAAHEKRRVHIYDRKRHGRKSQHVHHFYYRYSDIISLIPYEQVDAHEYSDNKVFMFSGEMVTVTIRCKKRILDAMIDIFGKDIKITAPDEDHYQFTVTVNDNGIIFLAQQYMDAIEIIYPSVLRKRFMELISYRTHKL